MIRFFLSFVILLYNSPLELKKIREHYPLMSKQESSVLIIKSIVTSSKTLNPTLKGVYFAAAEMTSAQYKLNPAAKIKTFNHGKNSLEAFIASDSTNIEARYIRYTIQQNAPVFLGYTKSKTNDRRFLIDHISTIKKQDAELFATIYAYLLTNSMLSDQEKAKIML